MAFNETAPTPNTWGNWAVIGAVLCVVSWVWSLATSISLQRAASTVRLDSLESFATGQIKMDEARIILSLTTLPEWKRNGEMITRTFYESQHKSIYLVRKTRNIKSFPKAA